MTRQWLFPLFLLLVSTGCGQKDIAARPTRPAMSNVGTETAIHTPANLTPRPTSTSAHSATPTVAPTSSPTATPTTTPYPTATPTATPTAAVWVEAGTPVPASGTVISPENATKITELAHWGRGVISDIDLSADGRWLAVAAGPAAYIHAAADLSAPPLAITTAESVSSVSIAPTGDKVALTVSKEVHVWQLKPLRLLFTNEDAWGPQFSPDGSALSVSDSEGVAIWDSENGEELAYYPVRYFPRSRFSPSGGQIAVWEEHGQVVSICDWEEGRLISDKEAAIHPEEDEFPEYYPYVGDVAFVTEENLQFLVLENGAYIYMTGRIEVQQADDGAVLFSADRIDSLTGATSYVCNQPVFYPDPPEPPIPDHMEISLNGQIAGIRYEDSGYTGDIGEYSSLRFYRMGDGQLLYAIEEGIVDFELSPNGQTWVAALQDGHLQTRQLSDGAVLESVDDYESPALDLLVSPDDRWIGVVYEDEVKIRHSKTGVVEYRYPADEIAFSPDGTNFALAYEDGRIEIRKIEDGSLTNSLFAHSDRVTAMTFLPSGELLSAGFDCNISLWRVPSLTHNRSLENYMVTGWRTGEQVPVRVADFLVLSDGQTVIGRFFIQDFGVWRVDDGQLIRSPDPEYPGDVEAVGSDGYSLAVPADYVPQSWDNSIVFIETESWLASFSPDLGLLVTSWGRGSRSLQLWQVSSMELLHTTELGTLWTTAVNFTHSGEAFLTASLDGVVRLWGIPPPDEPGSAMVSDGQG